MAFSLYASTGSITTQLNDGSPFWLESAEGLSAGDVIRHAQRGPLQNGMTDLGYRLVPRLITLNILFYATSDATLDTYRDELTAAFEPLTSVSTFLSVERDDGEIRTLVCHLVDEIEINLVPEEKAARLHRATVKLRAANPLLKANSVTRGSVTFSDMASWWLAGGAITSGSVRNHWEYIGSTKVTAFAGTMTDNWAIAVVTAKDTADTNNQHYVWEDAGSAEFSRVSFNSGTRFLAVQDIYATWPGTTDYNYHVVESRSGSQYWRYWNGSALSQHAGVVTGIPLVGANFAWRRQNFATDYFWVPEVRKAAIIQNSSTAQLSTLARYMLNTVQGSITLVNDGDMPAYPIITLHGPLVDPVIVNQTTNGTLSLPGTIGEADTWTINLQGGDKRIYDQNGSNVMGSVSTSPVSMADFYLAAAPAVAGGTNVLVMTPGSVGSAAYFVVEITSRYMSF